MRRASLLRLPLICSLLVAWGVMASVQPPVASKGGKDKVYAERQANAADSARREALRGLVARADSGDGKALFDLARLHEIGYDSIPVDSVRAMALYTLSAENGYAPAQNYLGFRLFNGEGVEKDVNEGLRWIEKAAMQGDAKGANNLGWMLSEGEGVVRDYDKAAFWLRRAAEAGLPAGQAQLADLLRTGRGVPADTVMADSLYCRAIEGGLRDAEAKLLSMQREPWRSLPADSALRLGLHHYTHRAPVIGVTLFEQIANMETPSDSTLRSVKAHALALLGDATTRALGADYDHDRSMLYFTEAALLGNPSAQFIIGELLEIFPDALADILPRLPMDPLLSAMVVPTEAVHWLDQAAAAGIRDAAAANRALLAP
ncbi:MAG: sel1 repeat family protein [Bacteroides sp.]|nr:sel1 repeat family protein [Bacteroides sp.]